MKKVIFLFITFFSCTLFLNELYSQTTCSFCGGTGTVNCISCGGYGNYNCNQCGGNGGKWERCTQYNCNGGVATLDDGTTVTCQGCQGRGEVWHSCYNPNCNGGTVSCNFCGNTGKKTCGTCGGDGIQ